jgi:hypothetical protein
MLLHWHLLHRERVMCEFCRSSVWHLTGGMVRSLGWTPVEEAANIVYWSKDSTLVEEAAAMERRNPAEISVPLCMGDISCAGKVGGLLGMGFNMRI